MHNTFAHFAADHLYGTDLSLPDDLVRSKIALAIATTIRHDFGRGAPQYTTALANEVIAVMRSKAKS